MSISLTPDIQRLVEERLSTGLYPDQNAVLEAALELLRERDETVAVDRDDFMRMVAEGVEQLERGDVVDGVQVFARLRAKSASRREGQP